MNFFVSALLLFFINSTHASTFNLNEVPPPIPDLCYSYPSRGPCRANLLRYRFNNVTNQCEEFRFGGCPDKTGSGNIFIQKEECERICVRSLIDRRAFGSSILGCSFSANPTRDCDLTFISSIADISLCADRRHRQPRTPEQCRARGCCSRFVFGGHHFCYKKTSSLVKSSCTIGYASSEGFWGKLSFQADEDFYPGWLGLLKFTRPIPSDLCILKSDATPNTVRINGLTFEDRSEFQLEGANFIKAGDTVTLLFSGGFDESRFSTEQCRHINLVSGRVIDNL